MDKERDLYDKFVDVLDKKLSDKDVSPKELEIVMNFLKNNNIQASNRHKGLNKLADKVTQLPFDDENEAELLIKRVK